MAKRSITSIRTISASTGLIVIGILCYMISSTPTTSTSSSLELEPYFTYSEEDLKPLEVLNSDKVITENELSHWVQVAFNLVKLDLNEIDTTRVYAYLFTAQKDAAAISYKLKNKLAGSLSAVSTKTLCLVVPDKCLLIPKGEEPDPYSLKVAEIVTKKVKERIRQEKEVLDSAPPSKIPDGWPKEKPIYGSNFGHMKPWLLKSGNQFRLADPKAYSPEGIKQQKEELLKILSSITNEQLATAKKWAAAKGSISLSGQWIEIADDYMAKHPIPLERAMIIRSVLSMGIADATIAYFDTKYTYWKLRPARQFADLSSKIRSPGSPSYPSGHSTIAMAAAIIMDHYFPENQTEWDKTAEEIGQSRLWGGVHFPVDDYDGLELGRKIGDWVVKKIKSQQS
ncbi:MAG: vanadium-dependent haloperoxidase [Alphaproteobacteria bacterium]|jgi:hypothetical protein|nr:vanadium-dependent haloperoxidase [Alphaproteobacteria bacterium]